MAGSEVVANLLPFISWAVLPQVMTKLALKGLYDVQIVTRPATPAQAQLHARRVQALVIVGYLLYTVYASIFRREANYYELLGVSLDSDADDVRRSFRRLARIFHPDKAGGRSQDESVFIEIRRAHDCLADPIKRAAYDRFGPGILDDKRQMLTERDIFMRGLQSSLSFYIVHPVLHGFVNWLSGRKIITYWLLTLYVVLLATEFSLIVRGQRWLGASLLPSTMTAHDLIVSLHSAYTALILASTHLANLLPTLHGTHVSAPFHHLFDGAASENDLIALHELVRQQQARTNDVYIQSGRNMDMSLLPLRPLPKAHVQTIQQAANEAAKRRARPTNVAANATSRQPSQLEQRYIHHLGQLLLRHRLEVIPAVHEAEKQRSMKISEARNSRDTKVTDRVSVEAAAVDARRGSSIETQLDETARSPASQSNGRADNLLKAVSASVPAAAVAATMPS